MTVPRTWIVTDAPYAGGAERYLEILLHAAGSDRLGVVGVDGEGLRPWLDARAGEGFVVDRIAAGPLRARWAAFWRWARARRPHAVHVNMPGPYDGLMATAPWLARRAGVTRVVVTEHLPGVGRVGKRYRWKRALLGSIDRAIVVCDAHRELMTRTFGYAPARVVAVHNGIVDPAPFRPDATRRADLPDDLVARETGAGPRVVQLGSLEERKGPERTLEAFAATRGAGVDASLWFVGDGPRRTALLEAVAALDLTGHVHVLGHRDDAPALLAAADVVTLASTREGLPFSLIEAAAWARPLVALDTDGVGEIVVDGVNGRLVPAHRPAAFARALEDACRDGALRARWGEASRRRYEGLFTLEPMVRRTFAHYRDPAFEESA